MVVHRKACGPRKLEAEGIVITYVNILAAYLKIRPKDLYNCFELLSDVLNSHRPNMKFCRPKIACCKNY